ncbi:MAG: hypothetical protein ACLT8E_02820 [Akkermansia sp.]
MVEHLGGTMGVKAPGLTPSSAGQGTLGGAGTAVASGGQRPHRLLHPGPGGGKEALLDASSKLGLPAEHGGHPEKEVDNLGRLNLPNTMKEATL